MFKCEICGIEFERLDDLGRHVSRTNKLTTKEYYDTTKFSNAYQVSVPAQYFAGGGIVNIAKNSIKFIVVFLAIVVIVWIWDGVVKELKNLKDSDICQ
jgi:hypothetical protein